MLKPSFFTSSALLVCSLTMLIGCKATLDQLVRSAEQTIATADGQPSTAETGSAIRQALSQGVTSAVNGLGKTDGFNGNDLVRIALPDKLQKPAELLTKLGQQRYVDEFVVTMNRAAESAVPKATAVFLGAIKQMSIQDAIGIMQGPDDSATNYFKRTSEAQLVEEFLPVVSQATEQVQVTKAYKDMLGKAKFLNDFVSEDAKDIDRYITQKSSDALFLMIAQEEKLIRQDPLLRTTELLKKVFSYYAK